MWCPLRHGFAVPPLPKGEADYAANAKDIAKQAFTATRSLGCRHGCRQGPDYRECGSGLAKTDVMAEPYEVLCQAFFQESRVTPIHKNYGKEKNKYVLKIA